MPNGIIKALSYVPGWENMKNAFPLYILLFAGKKEKSNLHCISAIFLSRNISNHQQNLTWAK